MKEKIKELEKRIEELEKERELPVHVVEKGGEIHCPLCGGNSPFCSHTWA